MRWRKKIEQRRSMRTKRPAVVKRKKEEAWKVAFRALFMEATYVERDGAEHNSCDRVGNSLLRNGAVFKNTALMSKLTHRAISFIMAHAWTEFKAEIFAVSGVQLRHAS